MKEAKKQTVRHSGMCTQCGTTMQKTFEGYWCKECHLEVDEYRYIPTDKLLDQHQIAMEILYGIHHFQKSIEIKKESLEGFSGTFPKLVKKYKNDIDTYIRCIDRLKERYNKLEKTL